LGKLLREIDFVRHEFVDDQCLLKSQDFGHNRRFNGDGTTDFAVMVIDRLKSTKNFELLVFNGPFPSKSAQPAFVQADQEGNALFFGPPRPKPYRLVVGPFESDNSAVLVPRIEC
jgi:hypothetical protein